jgi:hypothetical protein
MNSPPIVPSPTLPLALCAVSLMLLPLPGVLAEEGMWTLRPSAHERIAEGMRFHAQSGLLDRLRLSSARLNDGGSGSFVSADGLHVIGGTPALPSSTAKWIWSG